MYPIIEFTGGDRRGKQTQTTLLIQVLQPSVRLEFPNYQLYSGHIIQATLKEEAFALVRESGDSFHFTPHKDPEVFQLLQSINRVEMKPHMLRLRREGYVICDRYRNCAEAYGPVDGCDPKWLKNLLECHLDTDVSLVFVGTQLAKPGETPDINERNKAFQDRVMANFRGIAAIEPQKYHLIDIDDFQHADPIASVALIHVEVCHVLSKRLGAKIEPLGYPEIAAQAEALKLPQPPQLRLPIGR